MKKTKLKETMDHIRISETMEQEIIEEVKRRTEGKANVGGKQYRNTSWQRMAASAALVLVAAGVISIPVSAGIRYLVQERMERMSEDETQGLVDMMDSQEISADGFSREYSEKEWERMGELTKEYQMGTFPEGEIVQVEEEGQVRKDILCYAKDTGVFYLPERELTDEELLQIIDFNQKRNYSLEKHSKEAAERAEEQKRQIALVEAGGGISEAEAKQTGIALMETLFETEIMGMEENCYLDLEACDVPVYCVNYSVQSRDYYYFWINAADGELVEAEHSHADWLHEEGMDASLVPEQLEAGKEAAQAFLEEKLEIRETYEKVVCRYRVPDGKLSHNRLTFYFEKEDGTAYEVRVRCGTGEIIGFTGATAIPEEEGKAEVKFVEMTKE